MTKFMTLGKAFEQVEAKRPDIIDEMEETEAEFQISRKIIEQRKRLNMTQIQLINKTHLTQCQISRIENGSIKNFSPLKKVLDALDLEIRIVPKQIKKATAVLSSVNRVKSEKKKVLIKTK